jgi:mannose/fructose/N-acetylgalactosamine-specific phosphotransferase system component IID
MIQAVWNFKTLLSIGLCFCMIPVGKRLYPDREEYRAFLKRHLCFFNAHPYFASYALGAIARLEEEAVKNKQIDHRSIDKLKNALIGPLGSLGDQYFWAAIRPASALIGFTIIALSRDLTVQIGAIILILVLYNVPHLYIRAAGIWHGYQSGYMVHKQLKAEKFARVKNIYQFSGAIALGLFIGFTLNFGKQFELLNPVLFIGSAALAFWLRSKRQAMYLPIVIPLLLAVLFGILVEAL